MLPSASLSLCELLVSMPFFFSMLGVGMAVGDPNRPLFSAELT